MIRTLFWKNNTVVMIDQNALPQTECRIVCTDYRQVIAAIRNLAVRGAPAIGVAAAMGAALGALALPPQPTKAFREKFHSICDEIAAARPTARNLFWALERMKKRLDEVIRAGKSNPTAVLAQEARRICAEDIAINRQMGRQGSVLLSDGDQVLTHCNAGALASAGYGTALGVIRAAHAGGKKLHVYVDETRPVLQGARLTAWE
ncbi:MAG TPA: S-methyl-5-thioribose-1-phosphate isomerase, partial [Smithellaceae bacterium]|nr:S-methyl-5-thioribose-1-phosphate isomerase [Smithellaceae bacterium]HOQ71605.1 S-methyl-5-thioribose-1-phosphate isomerase [Smithellaceae bacterium]